MILRTCICSVFKYLFSSDLITDQTSKDLQKYFDGRSGVSSRLLAHALDNWSGNVDVLRHNSREIYESVIVRHLLFHTSGSCIVSLEKFPE